MRLIDADAFRRKLDEHYPFTKDEQSKHGMADIAKSTVLFVLNTMPTVEERKTGKWVHDGYDFPHGNDWIHCSVCGKRGINVPADKSKYCPNCGARMEGEER